MNIAVLTALASLILGLLGVGVKLGNAQAQIDALREGLVERPKNETIQSVKNELHLLRTDIDRRLDEKASTDSVRALKESVDLLRTDITTRLDSLVNLLSARRHNNDQ
jgi:hypothetical protein